MERMWIWDMGEVEDKDGPRRACEWRRLDWEVLKCDLHVGYVNRALEEFV